MDYLRVFFVVGNGFDISALNKFGNGVTTKYSDFYKYYCDKYVGSTDNYIISAMSEAKAQEKENWADLEYIIGNYLESKDKSDDLIKRLNDDLFDVQKAFSSFLNSIVTDDVISAVSDYCYYKRVAGETFRNFLCDLSEEQYKTLEFPAFVDNYTQIDFITINFNYTALLDNFLFLDKDQFDPEPYRYSRNNFVLELNPGKYEKHKYLFNDPYVHVNTEIIHPHGNQDVPKSLVFGAEVNSLGVKSLDAYDNRKKFIKSKIARCEEKFEGLFLDVKLFIIFGCSLGESDSWWWNKIVERVLLNKAEIIIYHYGDDDEEEIKDRFIENSFFMKKNVNTITKKEEEQMAIMLYVRSRIFVIKHNKGIRFMQFDK